ncbi:MAG: two-component system, response regulator / RNA-binding antiterminator [Acetobacteraceae bacterium]|jgi:two-component system, response regulator / RNA-binding antiterminator|nr:two-component system, response regulator / RNA-binding antiterminator [Acetobacteraceae bacterium]MEA2771756.1 two-component system, response regulator / RNA-binding antiterminator [Acetobacteraceae bacterium]
MQKPPRTFAFSDVAVRHSPCVCDVYALQRNTSVKVLLADDDAERAGAVARILATDAGLTVFRLKPNESLADAVASLAPDVVLVDMARPDRDALDGIRQVAALNSRPVVLFVDEDDAAFMEEAISAGVSSYNAIGMPPPDVKPILRAAVALFRRHQQAQDDLKQAENRLNERTVIDRAKAILIKQRRLSEPDAYKWLRRTAMSRGRRIVDVAGEVLKEMEGKAG